MTDTNDKAVDLYELDPAELQEMVRAKTLEAIQLRDDLSKLQNELTNVKARTLKVYEENEMMKAAPELAARIAEMTFEIKMSEQFVKSGAFPKMTPEQAYTIIRAGAEMGMKPVEAMNSLYIVNGSINPYGKNMIGRLTAEGYRVEYLNEKPGSVDVRVYHPDKDFDVTETASEGDQALRNSKALGFSSKNKLRFHGVRMVINFHIPHLFGSTADFFEAEAIEFDQGNRDRRDVQKVEASKQTERIRKHIKDATTIEQLLQVRPYVADHHLVEEYEAKETEILGKSPEHLSSMKSKTDHPELFDEQ